MKKIIYLIIGILVGGLLSYFIFNKVETLEKLPKPEVTEGERGMLGIDKNIFLICGGGGYAGMTKKLLVSLGWDENKIYNIGGYWFYDGDNNVQIKKEENGKTIYEFWKATYHDINFDNFTEIK